MVRLEIPATAHAAPSLAPPPCASSIAARISSRSSRLCRRPRPPTGLALFFEDQQSCGFRERLLLARQLAFQLADALGGRHRGAALLLQREPPLLEFAQQQALSLEVAAELSAVQSRRLGQDLGLLLDRPRLCPALLRRHPRQAMRISYPARERLLRDPGLLGSLPRADCVLPRQSLDHLLLVGLREWSGHFPRQARWNQSTRTRRQLRWHRGRGNRVRSV